MSRPLRIEYPGAWYHVMSRGRRKEKIFFNEKDYKLFLDVIGDVARIFNVGIHAYALMPNHYHLLMHTPEGNLSRSMRHLNGVYTQKFNIKHKIDGSLFRGRFKSILIEEEAYLLELVRYIHRNPKKAELENKIGEYRWCSHRGYVIDAEKEEWLNVSEVLKKFSRYDREAKRELDAFVNESVPKDLLKRLEGINWPTMLGGEAFKEDIKEKCFGEEIEASEKPAYKRDIIRSDKGEEEIKLLLKENADVLGSKWKRIQTEKRRALIYVMRKNYVLSHKEIGDRLGGLGYSAVSKHYKIAESDVDRKRGSYKDIEKMKRILKNSKFKT
ncbi:MAG: transposase [Candidatus Omnitrophota bacterium]